MSEAEDKFDLISEYHEPEPIPPAESEVDRLQRELDAAVEYHDNYTSKIDKALGQPRHGGDLLTEHLREIERLTYLPQTASPPAESPPLPSPWRPMTDDYPRDKVLWVARDDGLVYTERNPDEWLLAKAVAWMLAVTPVHPTAPPVVPKTRTVTLREYQRGDGFHWTTSDLGLKLTGRTCESEVPE